MIAPVTIDAGAGWRLTLPADMAAAMRRWDDAERLCARATDRLLDHAERERAKARAEYAACLRRECAR